MELLEGNDMSEIKYRAEIEVDKIKIEGTQRTRLVYRLFYRDQGVMTDKPEEIPELIRVMYRVQAQQDNACGDCG